MEWTLINQTKVDSFRLNWERATMLHRGGQLVDDDDDDNRQPAPKRFSRYLARFQLHYFHLWYLEYDYYNSFDHEICFMFCRWMDVVNKSRPISENTHTFSSHFRVYFRCQFRCFSHAVPFDSVLSLSCSQWVLPLAFASQPSVAHIQWVRGYQQVNKNYYWWMNVCPIDASIASETDWTSVFNVYAMLVSTFSLCVRSQD